MIYQKERKEELCTYINWMIKMLQSNGIDCEKHINSALDELHRLMLITPDESEEDIPDELHLYLNTLQDRYTFDESYPIKELSSIPKSKQGLYVLTNQQKEILYVGKSKDLQTRLKSHAAGHTNTKEVAEEFEYVALLYQDDPYVYMEDSGLIERALIELLQPKYNVVMNDNVCAMKVGME